MRTKRFWCGAAVAVAIAGFGGTALATNDVADAGDEIVDTVEMPAPSAQNAEIEATLAAVAAELSE